MSEQTLEQWMASPHLKTFLYLRLEHLDLQFPDTLNPTDTLVLAARRKEVRELQTWNPARIEEKAKEVRQTALKAGEFRRSLPTT